MYKYTAIKLIVDEVKVICNEELPPTFNWDIKDHESFNAAWRRNHKIFTFATKEEEAKVIKHLKIKYNNSGGSQFAFRFRTDLMDGVEADCIDIRDHWEANVRCYRAYFKENISKPETNINDSCPTCGGKVKIHSDGINTGYFEPISEPELTPEQEIILISGRIMDEYRKHSSDIPEWNLIAAKKIHTHWKEYFEKPYISKLKQISHELTESKNISEEYRRIAIDFQEKLDAQTKTLADLNAYIAKNDINI